jgi:hypothetical protein
LIKTSASIVVIRIIRRLGEKLVWGQKSLAGSRGRKVRLCVLLDRASLLPFDIRKSVGFYSSKSMLFSAATGCLQPRVATT